MCMNSGEYVFKNAILILLTKHMVVLFLLFKHEVNSFTIASPLWG